MILPLYSAIEKLDGRLLEAARDLGANAVQRFFRVILPLTMPGIVAGCFISITTSNGDVLCSRLTWWCESIISW